MIEQGKFADLAVSASRYERLELVGTGSFGEVYRGYGFRLTHPGFSMTLKECHDLKNPAGGTETQDTR